MSVLITNHKLSCVIILLLYMVTVHSQSSEDIPCEVRKISDRVTIFADGSPWENTIAAITTEKGTLIIDTSNSVRFAQMVRKLINKELGRNDIIYVINTHHHFDHTCGNQTFLDAVIIGHEKCIEGMKQFEKNKQGFVAHRRTMIAEWKEQLKTLDKQAEEAKELIALIPYQERMCEDLEHTYEITLPSLTFTDRMTMNLGDVSVNLIYYGSGAHTESDILIHIPEEKLLFSGDLFAPGWVQFGNSAEMGLGRWLHILNELFKQSNQIERIVTCHNGIMDRRELEIRRDYLTDLYKMLVQAKSENLNYETIKNSFTIRNKFAYLRELKMSEDDLQNQHENNVSFFWQYISSSK